MAGSAAAVVGAALAAGAAMPAPPAGTGAGPAAVPAAVQYGMPLSGRIEVVRRFDPPQVDYGAGHLGVDLRARQGQPVIAAADGIVQFAGQVAGRGVVVLAHPDGIRTEYEPLRPLVHTGDRIRAGAVIGRVDGQHPGCAGSCLHWGARRDDSYLDPLALLRPLGPVVLLPDR